MKQTEPPAAMRERFQSRVFQWMRRCFVRPDGLARDQRAFRFIEEALELAQAGGTSREDVLRLVEYVFTRPIGLVHQEIGGVMVTLAGLATSWDLDMNDAAELELQRCEAKTERIREKDLAKPQRSPLPGQAAQPSSEQIEAVAKRICVITGTSHLKLEPKIVETIKRGFLREELGGGEK